MEKPFLPTKTKIAAWWIRIIGGVGIVFSIIFRIWPIQVFILLIKFILPFSFLLFLSGCFLFWKRRMAWRSAVGILILGIISWIIFYLRIGMAPVSIFFVIFSPIFLIPFILLLLDRKNFWKIAT